MTGERAKALWEERAEGLRCSLREMMADSEVRPREAVMRTAATFRDAFECEFGSAAALVCSTCW